MMMSSEEFSEEEQERVIEMTGKSLEYHIQNKEEFIRQQDFDMMKVLEMCKTNYRLMDTLSNQLNISSATLENAINDYKALVLSSNKALKAANTEYNKLVSYSLKVKSKCFELEDRLAALENRKSRSKLKGFELQ